MIHVATVLTFAVLVLVRAEQHSLSAASDARGEKEGCMHNLNGFQRCRRHDLLRPGRRPPTSSTTFGAWRPGCAGGAGKHAVVTICHMPPTLAGVRCALLPGGKNGGQCYKQDQIRNAQVQD